MPNYNDDAFLARLSYTSIRVAIILLCVLTLAGPISMLIGFGILKQPDNYDARVAAYNAQWDNFSTTDLPALEAASGRLVQRTNVDENSTSSSSEVLKTVAVEILTPVTTRQPIPSRPALPSGSGLALAAQSLVLESNASSDAIIRSLWGAAVEVKRKQTNNNNSGSITMVTENEPATVLNLTDSITDQFLGEISLPPLRQTLPRVVEIPRTFCYSTGGDRMCTRSRMAELCKKQTKCGNAKYTGGPCVSGKACRGCQFVEYQASACIPISYSVETGKFSASAKYKSCIYPFTEHQDESESTPVGGDELYPLSGCYFNITEPSSSSSTEPPQDASSSTSDAFGGINSTSNPPLRVLLLADSDPYFIAQNLTLGTNIFPGLPEKIEQEVGIGLLVGGGCMILLSALFWLGLKLLMKKDEYSARHVYKAFGQVYIPSTSDYVDAIRQGRGYKHSGGFVPNKHRREHSPSRQEGINIQKLAEYEVPLDLKRVNHQHQDEEEEEKKTQQRNNKQCVSFVSAAPMPVQKY